MPNKKYKLIYDPKHPRAFKDGCVYEHLIVAENILKRRLNSEEVIHHKDGNKRNNSEENIIVFRTNGDHSRYHKQFEGLTLMEDGTYICKEIKKMCKICGKPLFDKKSEICVECYKAKRAEHIPSKEVLIDLVWSTPSTTLANRFGVSSKAIEKWCKKYKIDKPSRGYWSKKKSIS